MPLACIFTKTWLGPGWGCGTSFTCQEPLTAGTTAACIGSSSQAFRCTRPANRHRILQNPRTCLSHKPFFGKGELRRLTPWEFPQGQKPVGRECFMSELKLRPTKTEGRQDALRPL